MDDIEHAQEREQKDRALCLAVARNQPVRDYVSEVCTGCDYAKGGNRGPPCDGWRECLVDLQRRERHGR